MWETMERFYLAKNWREIIKRSNWLIKRGEIIVHKRTKMKMVTNKI
jgi:hypothetical protein